MATTCTRCDGSGFLNYHQLPDEILDNQDDPDWIYAVYGWMETEKDHDVQVCDCCGDGETWYGVPGEHYNTYDPIGNYGPYGYNGGLCECH